ncbi:MAG: HipA domain-containing protein [Gemmatimonadetes bacterium]|nr:HipA domain-containing protein [Gemmatimonadota bacterium]MYH54281.1 HipA domain-containing protein [Gemmatimonadota bacterium]MYK65103.1 HipA domain-containing protein [Gemmatimonadota bacterium]
MVTSDSDRFVFVALPGQSEYVIAGRYRVSVEPGGAPLGEFVYGRTYLGRPDAVELDPAELKLTERVMKTHSGDGLFGAIRDSKATSWGRPLNLEGEVSNGNEPVNQLRFERPGAVVIGRGHEAPGPTRRMLAIDELGRLQTALDAEREWRNACRETHDSGARDSSVRIAAKVTVEHERTLWVAKFGQEHSLWNQARVRHATLQLARECGVDVAPTRVRRAAGRDLLLVQRPDREWAGDGYACSRMIRGLTLLGTEDTPEERRHWSYLTLADEVRRTSSRPLADLHELFRRICFNAAITNLNDELLRPTMVAKGRSWRLAQATGPVPTLPVEGAGGDFAMICGPQGRSPSRENIVGGAGRFLLERPAAEAIFDGVSATVRASWYTVMRQSGVSEEDCELVARSIVHRADDR